MVLGFGKNSGFGFKQSEKASLGLSKTPRVETATIIVARAGTGDYETIQEAINSLPDGGTIQIKEGEYLITSTITLKSDINLVGNGNAIIKSTTCDLLSISDCDNLKIQNLIFDGGGVYKAITGTSSHFSQILSCTFQEVHTGIELTTASAHLQVKNCVLKDLTTKCTYFIRVYDGPVMIIGNLVEGNCSYAIYTLGLASLGSIISSNHFYSSWSDYGFYGNEHDSHIRFVGNYCAGDVYVRGERCNFVGNVINDAIVPGNYNVFVGNTIFSSSNTGTGNIFVNNN